MTSSRWSSLLLGTILATTAFGQALGEEPAPPVPVPAQQVSVGSTPDLLIDPAVLAAATIDAVRAGDAVTEEMLDRIMTGSIAPLTPGPRTGELTELRAPQASGLSEPKRAPEPMTARPAASPAVGPAAPEPVEANEASAPVIATTSSVVPAAPAVTPAVEATKPPEAAPAGEVPATVAAPNSTTPSSAVEAADRAPTAEPAAAAESAPAEDAAKPTDVVAVPAATDVSAATPESAPAPLAATPVETAPAPVATVPEAPATAVAAPASESVAAPSVATEAASVGDTSAPSAAPITPTPMVAAVEPTAGAASYSTASEPVKPAATEPAASAPVASRPADEAPPTAPDAPATSPAVVETTASAPAPVPVAAPTTDAAIAVTLAAEQAAAALKTALEELQPRAGSAEERADRAAILAFYADRAFLPLFVDAQGATDRARGAQAALMRADRDGLDPQDYALPQVVSGATAAAKAEAEIAHARAVVRFARHLQSGRIDPRRVHELVTPDVPKTEAREVLDRIAGSTSVAETLVSYAPPHEGYRRLKAMLAELRAGGEEAPMVMVPTGPLLKPGQKDARVALLRERLGVTGVASDAEVFDPALAEAVVAFQRERGLSPTGRVGRETVTALNEEKTGTAARIADMISNMERWRWLPRELGELHVFVNAADFHLDVMKGGASIHRARVIVGKPSNPTPIFSEDMRHVVVNPYWNVPYSIVKKEMIGKAQATAGGAFSRGGWEVEVGRQRVDPSTVDWSTVDASKVTIRQRPGDGNALGNIKFLFPNKHAVYLHDTSSRGLFAQKFRALSHGCVRVHEPFSFADAVLSEEPEVIDGAKLKKMIGGGEKTINLKRLVPVHITYFTAWVDDTGQLQNRPDIYGHDARVKRLLDL